MSVNKLLDVAGRSLLANQSALNVTSHNVANANNPNYSKQRVVFSQVNPDSRVGLGIGSGVTISDITRIRNLLNDKQIVQYNQDYSYQSKKSTYLSQIESVYSEPSDLGLSNLLTQFFDSWEELASNPSSTPLRNNVVNSAQKLTSKFKNIHDSYSTIKSDVKSEAKEVVNTINTLSQDILQLNREIYKNTAVGRSANDLLDKRAAKIEELSKLANVTVSYDDDNVANISIGGSLAIDRIHGDQFVLVEEDGQLKVKPNAKSGALMINSGELAALNEMYSKTIPNHLKTLDTLATNLMDKVNSIHNTGYTLHEPPQTGIDFFTSYQNGELEINKDIIADPRYIAVSADQTEGNGDLAISLAKIKDEKVIDGLTINESYSDFVTGFANEKVQSDQQAESSKLVLDQLQLNKAEYSGVSTDEEMVNVIKFQRSYNASAKLIQVADELFQTLIQMV